jgi:glyoxylase-like metal-dependent hydrolase (beta-lactamase superfamily II)
MDKLADGVWFVYAAGVGSWAVEFKDYITVVEGPASEARSLAANDAIKRAIPDKPIKYVVNTHAHYDHAGGLRTYPGAGIIVITQEMNKRLLRKGLGASTHDCSLIRCPNRHAGDVRNGGRQEGADATTRTLEIYRSQGQPP